MIDASELIWFESEGLTYFERSPMGAMLDHLEMAAHKSGYCKNCAGKGITDKPWTSVSKTGKVIEHEAGEWCVKCHGTGSVAVRMTAQEQRDAYGESRAVADSDSHRAAVDDSVLIRYAQVSRTLDNMARDMREAIETAYGSMGEYLATLPIGRAFSLAPMTVDGKALIELERVSTTSEDPITCDRAILCLVELSRKTTQKSDPVKSQMIIRASKDAVELLKLAEFSWDESIARLSNRHRRGILAGRSRKISSNMV